MRGPGGHAALVGGFAVAGACLCWAIDNNCTSKIAHVDAPTLASIKGIVAGVANITLALIFGAQLPPVATAGSALTIGLLGHGASLVLFVFALREIGAARTGAYYSTAPFIGAVIGLAFLHEPWSITLIIAGILMAVGVWLHLTEPDARSGQGAS
nr:DMT family transporter [Asticcacaulis solisilvae]